MRLKLPIEVYQDVLSASLRLQKSERQVRDMCKNGMLCAKKEGGRWWILVKCVDDHLKPNA